MSPPLYHQTTFSEQNPHLTPDLCTRLCWCSCAPDKGLDDITTFRDASSCCHPGCSGTLAQGSCWPFIFLEFRKQVETLSADFRRWGPGCTASECTQTNVITLVTKGHSPWGPRPSLFPPCGNLSSPMDFASGQWAGNMQLCCLLTVP